VEGGGAGRAAQLGRGASGEAIGKLIDFNGGCEHLATHGAAHSANTRMRAVKTTADKRAQRKDFQMFKLISKSILIVRKIGRKVMKTRENFCG
jgi:hypothetical protein